MAALWDVLRAEVRAKAGELREKGAANALKEAADESKKAAATTGGWLWSGVKDLVAGPGPVPVVRASRIPAAGAVVAVELPSGSVVEATVLEVDGRYCPLRARVELRGSSPDATAVCGEVLWAEIGGPASATDFEGASLNLHALPVPGASVRLELLKGGHATATVLDVYFEETPRARLSIPAASEDIEVAVPIHLVAPPREAAAVVGEALRRDLGGKVREFRDTAAGERAEKALESARQGANKLGDTISAVPKQAADLLGMETAKSQRFDREPMRELIVNEDEATDSRVPLLEETTQERTDSRIPLLEKADSRALLSEEVTEEATDSRVPLLEAEASSPLKDVDSPSKLEAPDIDDQEPPKNEPPQNKLPKAEEQAPDFLG